MRWETRDIRIEPYCIFCKQYTDNVVGKKMASGMYYGRVFPAHRNCYRKRVLAMRAWLITPLLLLVGILLMGNESTWNLASAIMLGAIIGFVVLLYVRARIDQQVHDAIVEYTRSHSVPR